MTRHNNTIKVASAPPLVSKRSLDKVRELIQYPHYSLKTEKTFLHWARFFILWSVKPRGMRHLRDIVGADVEAFLTMLANERQVSSKCGRDLLGHSDVTTTMISTHVLKVAAGNTTSPLDAMASEN